MKDNNKILKLNEKFNPGLKNATKYERHDDSSLDLMNLSIFSDFDIDQIQVQRDREIAFKSKIKRLRKKYFEKIERIHALNQEILLTKEFAELQDNGFLSTIKDKANRIEPNDDPNLNEEEIRVMREIKKENEILIRNRNQELINGMTNPPRKDNIFLKQNSCYQSCRNALLRFFSFFIPFQNDIQYLRIKGDSTLIILFQVLRLMFMISLFSILIFIYLIVNHFLTSTEPLSTFCKYGFPCVILYSRLSPDKYPTYSITLGVWIVFIFFCGIIYFFVTLTETKEERMFIRKESIVSQYFFTSWNFNKKTLLETRYCKEKIKEKCYDYLMEEKQRLKIKSETSSCTSNCCCRFSLRFLSWFLFIVMLIIFSIFLLLVYMVRLILKNNEIGKQTLHPLDIIADIVAYLLFPIFMIFFPFICSFFPRMEGFPSSAIRNKHVIIKYYLAHCWGLITFFAIQIWFSLEGIPALSSSLTSSLNLSNFETFGCTGTFTINPNYADIASYTPLPITTYSQCREDETGLNLLFISVAYFICFIFKDLFELMCCSCCRKMLFQPYENLICIFTMIILFSSIVPFIPIFIALLPIVLIIIFKYEMFKLKIMARNHFITYDSIKQRNKSREMVYTFLFCLIALIVALLYFYLSSFTHDNYSECVSDLSINVMFKSPTKLCGAVPTLGKFSAIMTSNIITLPFIGDIYSVLTEPSIIIITLTALISALVYWRINESKYTHYTMRREDEMVNSLHVTIDHLAKRDMITSILLKMSQKKSR